MTEALTHEPIDKSAWGDGPWQSEPDRVEWECEGLPCLMVRHPRGGHWCGYAAVPPGHPLHGVVYDNADINIHGGLTYADKCDGHVCHVPKQGQPEDVWWLGFDCAHAGDYSPGYERLLTRAGKRYNHATAVAANSYAIDQYRDLAYVQSETNRLAEQLAQVTK